MRISYSIFIFLLIILFFTRCDQLRIFGNGGSSGSGSSSEGGRGGTDGYGATDEYGDGSSSGEYTDSSDGYSSGDYDDNEIYCPAEDGDCEDEDERYSDDYDHLEDRYDGVSGDIDFARASVVEDYRHGIRANYPIERGRVYVEMGREGNHRYYSGKIEIAFKVRRANGNEEVISQEFTSGYGTDNQYNVWARFGGRLGFHAFFSDPWKGVILVINRITNVTSERTEADRINLTNQLGSGSIWFKSFRSYYRGNDDDCYGGGDYLRMGDPSAPPAPPKRCWFISVGPYDCQAWESGDKVRTFTALEPRWSCYKKLGDFDGLNISKAFDTDNGNIYIDR